MKNITKLIFGLACLLIFQACQNEHGKNYNDATRVDEDGLKFIKGGMEGGLTEIKASGIAITNSGNQRVIGFAKMMISDHTQADSVLNKFEVDKVIERNDTISGDHEHMLASLSKLSGKIFDKAYLNMMVTDHENALQLFTNGSKNTDGAISKFAKKTLPTIQMHLDSAKAILTSLK